MKKKKDNISTLLVFITVISILIVIFYPIFVNLNVNKTQEAKIIEVKNNTLKITAGEKYGDPAIYEIPKPKYKNYKEDETIYVIIDNNNVHITINPYLFISLPILLYFTLVILLSISIVIYVFVLDITKRQRLKKSNINISLL